MNDKTQRPKIGLALGSGASRGWSHIGIIKALRAQGIEPDVICGTSVGAIIGASYVAGNMQKLEEWVLSSSRGDVLKFFEVKVPQSGFVDSKRLSWFLHNYVAAEDLAIEALDRTFAAVATDLDTGREVWLTEGGLAGAVQASMAMPGLFPAVRVGGRWLVDGGLVNPVPVSVCHALGADIVIAVNLNAGIVGKRTGSASRKGDQHEERKKEHEQGPEQEGGFLKNFKQQAIEYSNSIFPGRDAKDEAPGLFYAMANSINIFQDRITRSRLAGDPADVVLSPQVARIGMLEFHRANEAIEEGERCVEESGARIQRVLGRDSD
jgi:NTE family protein